MVAGRGGIFMKKRLKKLAFAAMMIALCVIIGLVCKTYLTFDAIRITFENIPVILTGILLGPIYGAAVGVASDLISAPLSGFGINPVITLGSASIGLVSGLLSRQVMSTDKFGAVLFADIAAHFVGSMIIKSLGLLMYAYPIPMVLLRVPLYAAIGLAESYLLFAILKNKQIKNAFTENKK